MKEIVVPEAKRVLTINDYAEKMNVSRQIVYRWISKGLIKTIKLGSQQFIEKDTPRPTFD